MLVLIFCAFLAHGVSSSDNSEVSLGLSNVFNIRGSNSTFMCQMRKNTSAGFRWINETLDIEWLFSPAHSNATKVILKVGQTKANTIESTASSTSPGSQDSVKYFREVWPDLTIYAVQPEDAGTYTCHVVTYNISVSAELYVLDSTPMCGISNPGPDYYEGEKVNLTCSMGFHGNHMPKLDWAEPALHVDYAHLIERQDNTQVKVSSSIELQLQHMIDGKMFRCSAKFPNITPVVSCDTSFPPLSVKYRPFITHIKTNPIYGEHSVSVKAGTNLTLFCTGHGNPQPDWTWSFFTTSGKQYMLPCNSTVCQLSGVRVSDTGTYRCNLSNAFRGQQYSDHMEIFVKVIPSSTVFPYGSTEGPLVSADDSSSKISPYAIGAVVCASLAVILIVIFLFMALKMRRREARLHKRLTRLHDENFDDQEVELLDDNIMPDTSELPLEYGRLKQQWEIPRKDVRCTERIAKGSYVEVWLGKMRKYPRKNDIMKIAVKKVVAEATEKERKFFLAELEIMRAIQPHPNILPLIGCYTASDPWLMMVEYAVEGSLYQFLQLRRPGDLRVHINSDVTSDTVSMKSYNITAHKLICMAAQIVNGLQHINRYKMIYYRLRSANVLVCKGEVCKLSGFGFTKDIIERNSYESNSAPIRWMSPETITDNVFNAKTDVWSFGVLLWEILHFGHLPYPDMGPQEVADRIQNGYRMSQPPHCSSDMYNLMLMCWAEDPNNRPGLDVVMQNLATMADSADSHVHLDRLPDGLRSNDVSGDAMETIA